MNAFLFQFWRVAVARQNSVTVFGWANPFWRVHWLRKQPGWLGRRLLRQLQASCSHPAESVTADIHEGGAMAQAQWCRVCGAYRLADDEGERLTEWREPRPDWEDSGRSYRRDLKAA